MAKWTDEETKILEQTIEENEGIDFNDFVDLLATKIDRTKKSIIAKTNNDDKTKRLMRDSRIIRKKNKQNCERNYCWWNYEEIQTWKQLWVK